MALLLDARASDMKAAARRFTDGLAAGDDALLYFVGHRIAIDDGLRLLPTDIQAKSEAQVAVDALALQPLFDQLAQRQASFFVALIDSDTAHPFAGARRKIGYDVGGAPRLVRGQLAMLSRRDLARPAAEVETPNGLFARLLATAIEHQRRPIGTTLQIVEQQVAAATRETSAAHALWISDQLEDSYFFHVATRDIPATNSSQDEVTRFVLRTDVGRHKAVIEMDASVASCTTWGFQGLQSTRHYDTPPGLFDELRNLATRESLLACGPAETICTRKNSSLVAFSQGKELFRRSVHRCLSRSYSPNDSQTCTQLLAKVEAKLSDLKCEFNSTALGRRSWGQ